MRNLRSISSAITSFYPCREVPKTLRNGRRPICADGGEGAACRIQPAGDRHLGQQPRGGDLVAGEEDAVAAIDGGTVAPGHPGHVESAGAAPHHQPPPPGLTLAPVRNRDVDEALEA